jgi:hypothetical protein
MNKKTKMYLGLGVLALVAYYLWEKSSKDKANDTPKANYGGGFETKKRKMQNNPNGNQVVIY